MRWLVTGGSGFIGTNFINLIAKRGGDIINVDAAPPIEQAHRRYWTQMDITERASIIGFINQERPNVIVHLAAKLDFSEPEGVFQLHNVEGSRNILDAALEVKKVRLILTSTLFVNGPQKPFDNDVVFNPVNPYGRSKAQMEQLARSAEYQRLDWIIVRPTSVWGPFHPYFPRQLWKFIKRGFYMHPGKAPIARSYGYVENVVRQIALIANAPGKLVTHKVFYVGDEPIDSYFVLNAWSHALNGRPIRKVPLGFLRLCAFIGDGMARLNLPAPINSERLGRMATNYHSRNETIWPELGYVPVGLDRAVQETVSWLKQAYPSIYAA